MGKYFSRMMSVKEAYTLGRQGVLEVVKVDERYRGEGIYVIEFERGVKIGRSSNLCSRLKAYDVPWTQAKKRVSVYRAQGSVRFEANIKRCLKRYKHSSSPEFLVGLSFEEVVKFVESNPGFRPAA